MKKIYQTPETVTMRIATPMILAASDPQVVLDPTEGSVEAGEVESRRSNNIWDEEEEDF